MRLRLSAGAPPNPYPNPNPKPNQALSHCPPLTHYLRCCTALYQPGLAAASDSTVRQAGGGHRGQPYLRCKMTEAFTATLFDLLGGGGGGGGGGQQPTVVRPTDLLDCVHELMPTFRRHEQQDAQELLRLLLSVVHEQLQRPLVETEVVAAQQRLERRWRAATKEEWSDVEKQARDKELKAWKEQQAKGLYSPPPREPDPPQTSVVSTLFEGQLLSSVQCCACRQVSHTRDGCFELSLPLPGKGGDSSKTHRQHSAAANGAGGAGGGGGGGGGDSPPPTKAPRQGLGGTFNRSLSLFGINKILGHTSTGNSTTTTTGTAPPAKAGVTSLADCLEAFFATEHLSGDEQYKCGKCKSLQDCHKSLKLLHLPPVLALQLKRFRNMGGVGRKASDAISFPLTGLDLTPHYAAAQSDQSYEYELVAVVTHHGTSLSSGHYTAYVRGLDSSRPEQWYHKDDAKTTAVSAEDVQRAEAYLLFYRRTASTEHTQLCAATLRQLRARRGGAHVTPGAPPTADGGQATQPACLVSRGWLARLRCCEEPGPLTMDDVLCRHMQVDARRFVSGGQDQALAVAHAAAGCVWMPHAQWLELSARYREAAPAAAPLRLAALQPCAECASETVELQRALRDEQDLITRLDSTAVKPGEVWFIIESAWLSHWREYVIERARPDPPGPLCNWRLLSGGRTKPNLQRVKDYRGVNREVRTPPPHPLPRPFPPNHRNPPCAQVWRVFQAKYHGGPPICRHEIDLYCPPVNPPGDVKVMGPCV